MDLGHWILEDALQVSSELLVFRISVLRMIFYTRSFLSNWDKHFTDEAYQMRLEAAACEKMRRVMR